MLDPVSRVIIRRAEYPGHRADASSRADSPDPVGVEHRTVGATVKHVHAGWWVRLEGEERDLRDLAMHFNRPSLVIIEEDGAFWLGSPDFAALADPDKVQQRGRALVALATGALHVEFGRFAPPRVTAAVIVDESGAKKHFVHVSSSIRMHGEINARVERSRSDGSVEIVDLVAPPVQTSEWVERAERDGDLEDVLAILGREDIRWHDLYHVFEIIKAEVGDRMFADNWVTKAAVKRFTQTANSRRAIGGEARHGHDRFDPPKQPLPRKEAHALVLALVRRWLAEKAPPQPAREVVVGVRPAPEWTATISDDIS